MSGGSCRTRAATGPGPHTIVVPLPAEIDISNDGLVQDALARALASEPEVVVADGTRTGFCDCAAVTALVGAHRQAAAAGVQLRVVITSAPVRRLVEMTGAGRVLVIYPSLNAAQADRSPSEQGREHL
jgi:anti-sigma B factor antagonist